jgi:hypothetical protein
MEWICESFRVILAQPLSIISSSEFESFEFSLDSSGNWNFRWTSTEVVLVGVHPKYIYCVGVL